MPKLAEIQDWNPIAHGRVEGTIAVSMCSNSDLHLVKLPNTFLSSVDMLGCACIADYKNATCPSFGQGANCVFFSERTRYAYFSRNSMCTVFGENASGYISFAFTDCPRINSHWVKQ